MESPGNSNGQRTVSGSPGRAEQGVAGIPPGMETHLSGAPCQSGCQGFGSQGVSAGSFQQGFLTSDPWANWLNQRQAQVFTINSFYCSNSLETLRVFLCHRL